MQINIGEITLFIKQLHSLHFVQCAIQMEAIHKNGARCVLHSNIYWNEYSEEQEVLPLTVEYREPSYSFKKFSSFKRDKTCEREILISRFIDRFLRLELSSIRNKEFFVSVQTVVFHGGFDMCQMASLCTIINLRHLFPTKIACYAKNKSIFIFSDEELLSFSLEGIYTSIEIENMLLEAKKDFEEYFNGLLQIKSQYDMQNMNSKVSIPKIKRIDRKSDEIRKMELTHISENSMIFSRGLTSVMCFIDLIFGFDKFLSGERVQKRENILSQYFFPHFATSEGKRKSTSRREIGHSELVRMAFSNVIDHEMIVRIVSETLSADGSSSMAAVCAASATMFKMNLIKEPIAAISIGAFSEQKIIVDLSAIEDKYSLMDCKIVGNQSAFYAIQMDCKKKIPFKTFFKAMEKSKKALLKICNMISKIPRENSYLFTEIDKDRIGYLIGKNGSMKKNICYHIPTKMAISENGKVLVQSENIDLINSLFQFYGRKPVEKAKIAFFASEDFNGQSIKTSIGLINTSQKITGKKNDIIRGTIRDVQDFNINVKEIIPNKKF